MSHKNEALKISVQWAMEMPSLVPVRWFGWDELRDRIGESVQNGDSAIESALGWPPNTIAVLRLGFSQQLNRTTGWEETVGWQGLDGAESPVAQAAAVFRRGVAYRPGPSSGGHSRPKLQGEYPIEVLGHNMLPPIDRGPLWTIVDKKVLELWPEQFSGLTCLAVDANEHDKTLATVGHILSAWRSLHKPRHWQIVGGGLVADVAGFAAALAGADMDLVPTTLLAMVDACVGGKTGVNFPPYGKNQVGAWRFPRSVRVWSGWLTSLPERELRAGALEGLKHAILKGDRDLMEKLGSAVFMHEWQALTPLLAPLIGLKAEVVARDPGEAGERAILNLGHTLGHALEALSQERTTGETTLLHGEAVGYGLLYAVILSHTVAGLSRSQYDLLLNFVRMVGADLTKSDLAYRLGTPHLDAPDVWERISELISLDKKNNEAKDSRWVLLSEMGKVVREGDLWTKSVDTPTLRLVWEQFLKHMA